MRDLRFTRFFALFTLCLLAGCTNAYYTLTISTSPDFSLTVEPSAATVVAGTSTPAYSFTVNPLNGFNAPVVIAASGPAGFTCQQAPCAVTMGPGQLNNALQFGTAATLPPGVYTLTFVATSGRLTHTVTATVTLTAPPPSPDFSITVSPTPVTLAAGSDTPAYSFAVVPSNGFAAAVTITAAVPSGFTCRQSPCTVTSAAASIPNALSFATPATLGPGSYTLTFTATSGTLTHTAIAIVVIAAPVVPTFVACSGTALPTTTPTPGPTAFVYTGDPLPPSAVYDGKHNVVFMSNHQLGEIDVISSNSLAVLARIPVAQPENLDLTADLSTLIVGTDTEYFYRIDTTSLCVIDRPYVGSLGLGSGYGTTTPLSLADGSILFELDAIGTTATALLRWTANGGAAPFLSTNFSAFFTGPIVRSGDHQHLFFYNDYPLYNGYLTRYDVATAQVTTSQLQSYSGASVLNVNQDGSHVYMLLNGLLTLTDGSFNTLATYKQSSSPFSPAYVLSPAASRYYVNEGYYAETTVLDAATLKPLGYLPSPTQSSGIGTHALGGGTYDTVDGVGRILTRYPGGLALTVLDTQTPFPIAADTAITGGSPSEDDVLYGTAITVGYSVSGGIQNTPGASATPTSVSFSEGTTVTPIPFTASTAYNTSQVAFTVPSLAAGCADLTVGFNSGIGLFTTRAYCYGPVVDVVLGDTGPSTGGATMTLYGKGFGNNPVIAVGGRPTVQVNHPFNFPTVGLDPETIIVTVPPGTPGPAAITVSNGVGPAITLPQPYTYYTRTDAALASGAKPFQLLYDKRRDRLLWSDSARNLLVVASASTGQTLQEVPVGKTPWGIALSPDGTRIAVANSGDQTISVYDATSLAQVQSVAVPPIAGFFPTLTSPMYLAIMNNGKVIVSAIGALAQSGGYGFPYIYVYDLPSNTIAASSVNSGLGFSGCENISDIAYTPDGAYALFGGTLYTAATNSFTTGAAAGCTQFDLSADAAVEANSTTFSNFQGIVQNYYNPPSLVGAKLNDLLNYSNYYVQTLALNNSGSLAVEELETTLPGGGSTALAFLYDTQHGSLQRSVEVPGGVIYQFGSKLVALDPAGQRFWLFSAAGLTQLQFLADPLAVGEVQVNGTLLTLLGSGFLPGMGVTVDGQAVSPVMVNGTTSAIVVSPSLAPGTHSLTVTEPGQPSYTLPAAFVTH